MANFDVKLSAEDLSDLLEKNFPQINNGRPCYFIENISSGSATLRLEPDERHIRPGGTVSGPTLFALADYTAYMAILAAIGPQLLVVTSNLNINFLKKPEQRPILSTAKILKLGRQLCVLEIGISMKGSENLVAHASATYALPQKP